MYCPVDGMEYREGITRCPEHDVDLVDELPELEPGEGRAAWIDRLRAGDLPGIAAIVLAVAGIVYAVTGVVFSAWSTLAQKRDWLPTTPIEAVLFLQSAAWAIGLGALGCLGAAILARVYVRLTQPGPEPEVEEDEADEEYEPEAPAGAWFMPLLSTLVVGFAVAWAVASIWIAWKTATAPGGDPFGFMPVSGPGDDDDLLSDLFAFQSAAFACLAGSLAAMGALLMARAHDHLSGVA